MKTVSLVNISWGLLVGSALLLGCGSPEASEPVTSTDEDAEVIQGGEANPDEAAEVAESRSTNVRATPINPPKAATLTAQDSEAEINLRSQPTTDADSEGYGLVGDPIDLLQAVEGDDGLTWYYVKFKESGAEGWIRGDFINTAASSTEPDSTATNPIDSFTTDELFAVDGGGCGMTLWPSNEPGDLIFFNTSMWMKLGGDMTQFRRTAASGPEFYGQSASQTFQTPDGRTTVDVTVSVGSEAGYESVNIEQGTLQLTYAGEIIEIVVAGDAGC